MNDDTTLTVGEVAERCDVSRDAIRYWEDRGLIPEPPRDESSGYRAYPPETVRRVRAIVRAKDLGLTLDEIRRLFERQDRGETCEDLGEIVDERIATFRREIEELQRKIDGLKSLGEACPGDLPATDCPVLHILAES